MKRTILAALTVVALMVALSDTGSAQVVEAREGVHVLDVIFEGEQAVGVRIKDADGERREVRARAVVDASGQAALLQNRFKLRLWDPVLNKGAIWTYWEGAYRDSGRDEGATMVLQTSDRSGWFWYIPQHNNIVSVGVVAPYEYLFVNRTRDHEKLYFEEVAKCPGVQPRIAQARRVAPFRAAKEYSYRSRRAAGDGPDGGRTSRRLRRVLDRAR